MNMAGEWKPIEKAPLDVPVLIAGSSLMFVGRVYEYERYDGTGAHRGFSLLACDCQTGCGDIGIPTHFMLLPLPPEEL